MTSSAPGRIRRKVISLLALIVCDLLTLLAAFSAAFLLRMKVLPLILNFDRVLPPLGRYLQSDFLPCAVILLGVFFLERLYSRRMSFWEEVRHLVRGLFLTFVLLVALVFIRQSYTLYSRPAVVLTGLISLGLFPLTRMGIKRLLVALRLWNKKVLILGTGEGAKRAAVDISENSTLGYELVGFLSDTLRKPGREVVPGGRILGPIAKLETLCRAHGVQDIIIALPRLQQKRLGRLMERCERSAESIRIVPDFGTLFLVGAEADNWGDILSLTIPRNLAKPWNTLSKRLVEYVLASILVVLFIPVAVVISLAIRVDSRGPILYRQERLGRKKRTFSMLKFRSMFENNRTLLRRVLRKDRRAQEDWDLYQKIRADDPRVTRVGRFLRRYSLDELPQLINVLRGDMSLIGPRPYLPREQKRIGRYLPILSEVRPGLTGLWQVQGRNRLTFGQRLAWDEYYIRNWSLWLDVIIFFRTLKTIARKDGAY